MEAVGTQILLELGLITVVATLLAGLAHVLKQPLVLAYLLAGVLIGPTFTIQTMWGPILIGAGLITTTELITLLSALGISFLLFSIGVESEFIQFLKSSREVVVIGILQVFLSVLLMLGIFTFFPIDPTTALYLAVIMAFSSTTVIVKVLSEKNVLHTIPGRLLITILLVQDFLVVLAIPLLNIDPAQSSSILVTLTKAVGLLVVAYLFHRYVFPRIFTHASHSHELLFLSSLSIAFIFMEFSQLLGFSPAIGAFLAGLSISTLPINLEVSSKIRGLKDFFATIFFVSLGLQFGLNFSSISWTIVLLLILGVIVIKPLITALLLLAAGYGGKIALISGLTLGQISEFSFILATQGLLNHQIDSTAFSAVVLVTGLSLVITPRLNDSGIPLYEFLKKRLGIHFQSLHLTWNRKLSRLASLPNKSAMKNHVVILGMGRMGQSLVSELHHYYPVVGVDNDPEVIEKLILSGKRAIYSEAANSELWQRLNLKEAKLLVITIPNINHALFSLKEARLINPKIPVFARASYPKDALILYDHQVDHVILPYTIASNILLRDINEFMHTGETIYSGSFKDEFLDYLRRNDSS